MLVLKKQKKKKREGVCVASRLYLASRFSVNGPKIVVERLMIEALGAGTVTGAVAIWRASWLAWHVQHFTFACPSGRFYQHSVFCFFSSP